MAMKRVDIQLGEAEDLETIFKGNKMIRFLNSL